MRKLIKLFTFISFILLVSSCNNYKDLVIDEVKSYHFKGFDDNKLVFTLIVPVENPNNRNIVVSEVNLKAYSKNIPLGEVETINKLVFLKHVKQDYEIPVTIRITNLLAGFSLLTNSSNIIKQLTFDGYIRVRKGLIFTTVEIDKGLTEQYLKF